MLRDNDHVQAAVLQEHIAGLALNSGLDDNTYTGRESLGPCPALGLALKRADCHP